MGIANLFGEGAGGCYCLSEAGKLGYACSGLEVVAKGRSVGGPVDRSSPLLVGLESC